MIPWKKFISILAISLCIVLCSHQIAISSEPLDADQLTVEGQIALQNGDHQQALSLFQQAESLYQEAGNEDSIIGTQVNQGITLDQAGHKYKACTQLTHTLNISGVCDSYGIEQAQVENSVTNEPGILGLQALAHLLIDIGYLDDAKSVTRRLVTLAPNTSKTLLAQLVLKNAEIEVILHRQKLSLESISPRVFANIEQNVNEGDRLLLQLLNAPANVRVPAVIHSLKTETLIREAGLSIKQMDKADLYRSILTAEEFQSLGYKRFNALTSSIDSLIQLSVNQEQIAALLEEAKHSVTTQRDQAKLALLQGRFLDSQNQNQQFVEPYYQRAAELATLTHRPRLAYKSYYHLALLNRDSPDLERHLLVQAIDQLEQAKETLAITPNLLPQLEFDIQTIFHEYMEVLRQQGQPIGPTHSTMKRWRIDSYLKCSNYTSDEPEPSNDESVIHITLLDNAIVTSIQKNGMERQYVADKEPALTALFQLLHELKPRNATHDITAFKVASKKTYDLILKSAIEENFAAGDTLRFNVDPALEILPMASLNTGEQFLVEEFPIAYNADSNRYQDTSNTSVTLIGSMSIQNPDHAFSLRFPPLPEVDLEARSIQALLRRVYRIDNEQFTLDNFKDALDKQKPSIVHIATHGLFSANPRDTALVAWDQPLHPQTLGKILRSNPLKLLVFSSCDTAQGGRLGIAGLALQSGAKSTVASLSAVDSRASFILMSAFYQNIKEGNTAAQSLRKAQKTLVKSSLFNHPAYWSPFILLSR